jgi:hypothetical protein
VALQEAELSSWFRPKRYGYGATPNTWQGWLLTLAFVAALAGIMTMLESGATGREARLPALVAVAAATALFIWISWKKTDGPWRWRWGPDRDER